MNSIKERIAKYLKEHTPFNLLDSEDLMYLSEEVSVRILHKGETIFQKGEDKKQEIYLVNEGFVVLLKDTIIDFCNEGDLFGLRPLISEDAYHVTARAEEDTILYVFPLDTFRTFLEKNYEFYKFIVQCFASKHSPENVVNPTLELDPFLSLEEKSELFSMQKFNYTKKLRSFDTNTSAKAIAKQMQEHKTDAVIILKNEKPVGCITNKDLIEQIIVAGKNPESTLAAAIMNKNIVTAPKKINLQQAQFLLFSHNVDHIWITEDGTTNSKVLGTGNLHDVMINMGNHPYALFQEIKNAKQVKHLKKVRKKLNKLVNNYISEKLPMLPTLNIISQINGLLVRKAIDLALEKMENLPPVKFAWIALGSQGRGEQLIPSDQDNALVFQDVPKDRLQQTQSYFLELANKIVQNLYKIGYAYCPAKMMANQPKWCHALSHWQEAFANWIEKPRENSGLLFSSVFFDFDCIYGDKNLTNKLSSIISKNISQYNHFLRFLTKELTAKPLPIGFFRQFIVEHDGNKKDSFNIKIRCIIPLIDAARILCLQHNIKDINNTVLRYEKLATLEPHNSELFKNCADSFKILLRFRTEQAIANKNSGKIIYLSTLSKSEKIKLKRSFKPIKEIKELLSIRFQTQQIF